MRAEHHTVSPASQPDDARDTLVIAGRLVRGDGADWTTWWSLVASMPRGSVNLDLSGVTAIDAAGAGLLARLAVQAWCHGRELRIVAASARARRVLEVVRLDTVLSAAPNRLGPLTTGVDCHDMLSAGRA
jgi:anti-anti-sigma factor